MSVPATVRIGPAETTLIDQLTARGAAAAAERLALSGLPTRKVETYHYTDLKMLLRAVPGLAGAEKATSEPALRIPGAHRIPMTNGAADLDGTEPAGVRASIVKGSALSERDDVLVRLNMALAAETLKLDMDGAIGTVLHIDRRTEGDAGHMNDSVRLFLADGGKATVIETFSGTDEVHSSNHASYVAVGREGTSRISCSTCRRRAPPISPSPSITSPRARGCAPSPSMSAPCCRASTCSRASRARPPLATSPASTS